MDEKQARILIIDDEEIVRDACTQILIRSNYEIATAPNGEDGLALLPTFQPDLALVDLKMPGLSGYEVLAKIQEYDPTIVTIVITGFATVDSAVESMKKGTFDFLPKPFKPDELRLTIRRGLERRKLVLETIAMRREKDMLREHFAAIVSHELKSPLGAVQANLFVLADDLKEQLTEEQSHRIERIQVRIGDLVTLVNTWLRAISVDISSIRGNFKPVTIPNIISKALENVLPHATRKAIEISTHTEEPLNPVHGDEGTLVEAIANIVGNAVKYTRIEGHVSIDVKERNNTLIIAVSDNGVGIAPEDIPHLFTDFYIGKSKTEGERRSGVGLAITRRIIEAHDGNITVESTLGEGSIFTIQLPVMPTT